MATVYTSGIVTAYGAAVQGGYQGTYEDFCAMMADLPVEVGYLQNMEVDITALDPGEQATASYSDGVLSLGIPKGENGDVANVAPAFDSSASYSIGDFVIYNSTLYICTNPHTGAWSASDFEQITVTDELKKKANIDGSYDAMTVGVAKNLESSEKIEDKVPYVFRPVPDGAGNRETDTIIGGTVAWNQLVSSLRANATVNGLTFTNNFPEITVTGTCTVAANYTVMGTLQLIENHVYIGFIGTNRTSGYGLIVNGKQPPIGSDGVIYKKGEAFLTFNLAVNEGETLDLSLKPMVFDLTQMFGSTIADYIYSLEQANAGAGVAWFRKLLPKPYYAYNAGELLSVSGLQSHDMVGFNQWDEEWEVGGISASTGANVADSTRIRSKNYIYVVPSTAYYYGGYTTGELRPVYYDDEKNLVGLGNWAGFSSNRLQITPNNCQYMRFVSSPQYGTTYNHDICINLSWDGERDGEYEPYKKWSYPLDSSLTLRGIPKLDANNDLYYDGDVYESDGTVTRRYGVVDLGATTYSRVQSNTEGVYFFVGAYSFIADAKRMSNSEKWNLVSSIYSTEPASSFVYGNVPNKSIGGYDGMTVRIRDDSYTSTSDFKTAMSGVYLVYELATPTTETAEPYTNPQSCAPGGTEEYVDAGVAAGTRDVSIPVGHDTLYNLDLVGKLEDLPSDFSTLIAPTEKGYTATRAYTVNQFLIVANQLYKVTANIANGGTITPGTNVTATTICDILTSLL